MAIQSQLVKVCTICSLTIWQYTPTNLFSFTQNTSFIITFVVVEGNLFYKNKSLSNWHRCHRKQMCYSFKTHWRTQHGVIIILKKNRYFDI